MTGEQAHAAVVGDASAAGTPADRGRGTEAIARPRPLEPGAPVHLLGWLRGGSKRTVLALLPLPGYVLIAISVTATIALGTWGFRSLPLRYRPDLLLSIYRAVRLYTLDFGPATGTGGAPRPNVQLWVAMLLAAGLVLRGAFVLARNSLRRTATRYGLRGHVIVCGAGVHGSVLAATLADAHDVVLIDIDASAPGMREPYSRYEWRLTGDCAREQVLVGAGVARAHQVVAITGNDYLNSQVVSVVRALAERGGVRDGLRVLVQAEDPSLARFMEEEDNGESPAGGKGAACLFVSPFSANAIAAEALLDGARALLPGRAETVPLLDGRAPNLLLAGDHPLIDALILAALRRWRVRLLAELEAGAETASPPLHVSVLGPDARERVARLRALRAPEPTALRIEALDIAGDAELSSEAELWLARAGRAEHAIVVCQAELDAIGLTVDLSRALGGDVLMTRVTTEMESVFDRHLEERTARDAELATTEVRAIAQMASDPSHMSRLAGERRLAHALSQGEAAPSPAALAASAELFARREQLGIRSDSAWRPRPGERTLLATALEPPSPPPPDPVPLSAVMRAGLRAELPSEPVELRRIAERLSRRGNPVAFAAWCEYARRTSAAAPPVPPGNDCFAGADEAATADQLLALRRAVLGEPGALAGREPDGELLAGSRAVAIFAGAAGSMTATVGDQVHAVLEPALAHFDGTILSGGTAAGMPGIIGAIARRYSLRVIGYAPPGRSERSLYPEVRETAGAVDFSIREPLGMWTDILNAGIAPDDVRLVACPGGQITTEEILLARALGASVGWLDPARTAPSPLDDMLPFGLAGEPPVLELPSDPMTVRAFIAPSRLPEELRVPVARYLHQAYRHDHDARKTPGDPALESWDSLLPSLRDSNLAQADDIPSKLAVVGLRLERAGTELHLDAAQVELLAEIEHGRWNLERIAAGWHRGEREVSRNITPYLKPWTELDQETREWDREAVRRIAPALAELGWGVAPLARPA